MSNQPQAFESAGMCCFFAILQLAIGRLYNLRRCFSPQTAAGRQASSGDLNFYRSPKLHPYLLQEPIVVLRQSRTEFRSMQYRPLHWLQSWGGTLRMLGAMVVI
jgi:hypothetical protein